jgi:Restriction endonuclease
MVLNQPPFQTFSDEMKPAEFEAFCAEELRRAGWDARVTMQSRDQGVDVVAEKNHVRVVIQCKLYARPVGNKSVQEAAAGKAHEQADYGIVVTNNRYTLAAEQLAATNGVLLLHYRDLQNLEGILSQKRGPFTQRYVMRHRSPQNLGSALGAQSCQLRRPSANLWRPSEGPDEHHWSKGTSGRNSTPQIRR